MHACPPFACFTSLPIRQPVTIVPRWLNGFNRSIDQSIHSFIRLIHFLRTRSYYSSKECDAMIEDHILVATTATAAAESVDVPSEHPPSPVIVASKTSRTSSHCRRHCHCRCRRCCCCRCCCCCTTTTARRLRTAMHQTWAWGLIKYSFTFTLSLGILVLLLK